MLKDWGESLCNPNFSIGSTNVKVSNDLAFLPWPWVSRAQEFRFWGFCYFGFVVQTCVTCKCK